MRFIALILLKQTTAKRRYISYPRIGYAFAKVDERAAICSLLMWLIKIMKNLENLDFLRNFDMPIIGYGRVSKYFVRGPRAITQQFESRAS